MAKTTQKKIKLILPAAAVLLVLLAIAATFAVRRAFYPKEVNFKFSEMSLFVGQTAKAAATTTPTLPFGDNLTYKSSDETVATVSANGTLNALAAGNTTITATHKLNHKSASFELTVRDNLVKITLDRQSLDLDKGESYTLLVKTEIEGDITPELSFASSNSRVATVNDEGIITAIADGVADITVSDKSGDSKTVKVTVTTPLEGVSLEVSELHLKTGESVQVKPILTPSDATNGELEYFVAPSEVAEVTSDGVITAKSKGTAYLTVKNPQTGLYASGVVFVTQKVTEISLSKTDITLYEGQSAEVKISVLPSDADNREFTYYNANGYVAETSLSGNTLKVKALSEGSTTVYFTSSDNPEITAQLVVRVKKREVVPQIEPTYIDGILVVNKTYALPANYNSGGGLTKETTDAFAKMQAAAKADGINLYIASGYRSYERQRQLFNNYLGRGQGQAYVETYSARPGHSEHQAGVAIDVNMASSAFLGTKEQKWLEANCVRFGFIIRYPKGKEDKTGFMYEPWHIRYLGVETAQKVNASGLCLEEYLGITSVYSN